MDIDLVKFSHLLTVARTGSFSRAARELRITQPALSRSVAALEQQFGVRLLDRSRSGVTPTAIGTQVLAEADTLVRDSKLLSDNLRLYSRGDAGEVAVGLAPLVASLILPRLAVEMLTARPRLQLRSAIKPTWILWPELLNREIELMFCISDSMAPTAEVEVKLLKMCPLGLFVRAGHPLAERAELMLECLADYPYAAAVKLSLPPFGASGALICENFNIVRQVVLHSDTCWFASPDLVADDMAAGRLVQLPLIDAPLQKHRLVMAHLKRRTLSPAAVEMVAGVERMLQDGRFGGL